MNPVVVCIQGIVGLVSWIGFLWGYFGDMVPIAILCGLLQLLGDMFATMAGRRSFGNLIIWAVLGGAIIRPWYLGVVWPTVALSIFNVPMWLRMVFAPNSAIQIDQAYRSARGIY